MFFVVKEVPIIDLSLDTGIQGWVADLGCRRGIVLFGVFACLAARILVNQLFC
jgi:hypothetical protein